MSYKTILVHVDAADSGVAARVQCAVSLAQDFEARLIGVAAGLSAATIELLVSGGMPGGGIVADDPNELQERFSACKAEFDRWTTGADIATEWRTVVDFPTTAIANLAGVADLIVVGGSQAPYFGDMYMTVDCGDLVMRAGRPVLAVPPGVTNLKSTDVVVAWKNTREARRAIVDALPLLAKAPSVTLFHVKEGEDETLKDAQAFLQQHCIGAATNVATDDTGAPGEQIVNFATRSQARLIVTGAYGHTRFREWAFGGVTRHLIRHAPVACLFSH